MSSVLLAVALISSAMIAFPCTCVTAANSKAKTLVADVAVVFRGVVIERQVLPSRLEMRGRNRYAITFRVEEYWKGSPGRTLVVYGLDPGADCLGDGGYRIGKEYLVFALEQRAKDVLLDDYFWYGWKDILPEGTAMLVPAACSLGGEVTKVRATLQELGPGREPPQPSKQ